MEIKSEIFTSIIHSPIGLLIGKANKNGIISLEFEENNLPLTGSAEIVFEENKNIHLFNLKNQLEEYFSVKRKLFDLKLSPIGTPFQLKVWSELLKIQFGKTRTYKEQSISVGDLKAIRAVATANGANPIAIIIPCHRIIGSDGSLTGYAGGLWRKKWLLDFESEHSIKEKQLSLNAQFDS